jgi:transcriptional regulator with XRE-family HTH domain
MINSDNFSKRLHMIMDYYKLSASAFAEKIQVQRSSISHILSGRNKPSLEFVMKIIKEFDEVELYWLLNGKGSFPKNSSAPAPTDSGIEKVKAYYKKPVPHSKDPVSDLSNPKRAIERIVIFYSDGTFKEYIR